MSSNAQEYADWIALEGLRKLLNPLEIGGHFSTEQNKEYTKSFPIGSTLRVPFPKQYIGHRGIGWAPEPMIDLHATVVMEKLATVDLEWEGVELALNMPRSKAAFSKNNIEPAMDTINQILEDDCALWASRNTPNVVGVLGTNPTTFDGFYGAASQRMEELGASKSKDRAMFLAPSAARALRASAVAYFNPPGEIARMWKKGAIGERDNFESYSTPSLYQHTAGTWAGAVTVSTTSVSGATTLAVTCTTGDTFLEGDSFSVSACNDVNRRTRRSTGTLRQFQMAASTTGAASAATLQLVYASSQGAIIGPGSPYQNVDALPLSGATLTLFPGTSSPNGKVGTQGLAFTRDAFALVSVPLPKPEPGQGALAGSARDPNTGITVNYVEQFDAKTWSWVKRLVAFYGFGNFYNDTCSIRCLGA